MTQHRRILNLISLIRDGVPDSEFIFTNGSCLNLFCILHSVYPQAVAWFNIEHIITEIDGKFYDIDGVVFPTKDYKPYTSWYNKRRTSRSFIEMYNYKPFNPNRIRWI